jgi:hypothetical protein
MRIALRLLPILCLLAFSITSYADTVAEARGGVETSLSNTYFYGQSFTAAAGGPFHDITFNFYDPSGLPSAVGVGFLLSQVYTGDPSSLNSSTPGFLGSANASGNLYSFADSLTLQGGTQYFFFENMKVPSITGVAPYGGGIGYYSVDSSSNFLTSFSNTNFTVTGDTGAVPPAAPEPSPFVLLGTGILGMARAARRKLFE